MLKKIKKVLLIPVCLLLLSVMSLLYIITSIYGFCIYVWRMTAEFFKKEE